MLALRDDARRHGARLIEVNPAGESCNPENRVFPPTFVGGASTSMAILKEEIFGPILPVLPYKTIEEAISYINERPRPLTFYYFDHDSKRIKDVLAQTVSGGATINDVIFHFAQNNLPFGGIGPSGMGHYHGIHGFETFSKKRGVFFQSRLSLIPLLRPPYGRYAAWSYRLLAGRQRKS